MTIENRNTRYQELSEQIQRESDAYFSHLVSTLMDESYEDSTYRWDNHMIRMIALRSERMAITVEHASVEKNDDVISQDFDALLENIREIEYKSEIDEDVVSDAMECVLAVADDRIRHELEGLCKQVTIYPFPQIIRKETTDALFVLLTGLADFYYSQNNEIKAERILFYLIGSSKIRNKDNEKHHEIVVKVLSKLGDSHINTSYNICTSEMKVFKGLRNEYAADFLWFAGCALQGKGKRKAAKGAFKNCYMIRKDLYGENDWFTAVAKREYSVISLLQDSNEIENLDYLIRFVHIIEENGFGNVDEDVLKLVEGKTLYIILLYKLNHGDFFSFEHLLENYYKLCVRYNDFASEPLIKTRLYFNFLGGYNLKIGNYIQAESAFYNAVNAEYPIDAEAILTSSQVKTNLLMAYYVENDIERAVPLLMNLLEIIDNENSGLSKKDKYRILTLNNSLISQAFIELDDEDETFIKGLLNELFPVILGDDFIKQDYTAECVVFIITAVQVLMQNARVSGPEYEKYFECLLKIKTGSCFCLDQGQDVVLCLILSTLAWELHNSDAAIYIKEAVRLSENAVVPISTKAAVLQTAATILSQQGEIDTAFVYLKRALRHVTEIWHSYIKYFNDRRLLQILLPTQLIFSCCYTLMRGQEQSIRVQYEKILQYKDLASLAGKERNKLLNGGMVDHGLISRIRFAQDRMAAIESENFFIAGSEEYEKEVEHLRNLEAEFARKFPDKIEFTKIKIDRVIDCLPDNSAVVEYYLCADRYVGENIKDEQDVLAFDVFVMKKIAGQTVLEKVIIPKAETLSEDAVEFISILQDESAHNSSIYQMERKEVLRLSLYKRLVEPLENLLSGVKKIFIAPDGDIINLPFDILGNEDGELLGDKYNLVKMECARDFLFNDTPPINDNSLIIGNPQFEIKERIIAPETESDKTDRTRFSNLKVENIKQLPFSELEANLIGKYCKSRSYTGIEAGRKLLLSEGRYKNIHLATHGYYDLNGESDSIYSSCLLFAGVKNWLKMQLLDDEYGNGIITADEISRLNFRGVELVILSACYGGMNDAFMQKGFQGLVGGFSASGVKYVISNLWRADDLGTAILMDALYYQYIVKKKAPPTALKKAQQYLRKVTVGDLKKRNWFDFVLSSDMLNDEDRKLISGLKNKSDRYRPFKNEIYWAGFTCFRCN